MGSLCRYYLKNLNCPIKRNNLVSARQNYFILMGYIRTRGGGVGGRSKPLKMNTLWIRHCYDISITAPGFP